MDLKRSVEAFKAKGYQVSVFPQAEEAVKYLNQEIDDTSVGIGGSVTIEEMGLYETLSAHNQVYWHWRAISENATPEILQLLAASARIYLTSANAVTENGEIVNIDGNGNRIAATFWGHKKVYFIIGTNKIMPDLQSAVDRARNIAAPRNAKRIGCNTPCAEKADRCYDCSSKDRICNGLSVHFQKMNACEMEVIIIEDTLGY